VDKRQRIHLIGARMVDALALIHPTETRRQSGNTIAQRAAAERSERVA